MLSLANIAEWAKISSPYQNSEEIPELILKLKETFDKEILTELTTEYMYHQGSLYEATFTVFPHLIAICESTDDKEYQWETLLNLSLDLSEFNCETELNAIFNDSKCEPETVADIVKSFKSAFKKLKPIAHSLLDDVLQKDETEKRYFLLVLAVANEIYNISALLWRYSENEEYELCCPHCEEMLVLSNEDGALIAYKEDPVFKKNQEKYFIIPASLDQSFYSEEVTTSKNYEWMSFYIHKLNIETLKTTINYLFGTIDCPHCNQNFNVFENIPL